jgi:broad-specificity NMP kinase
LFALVLTGAPGSGKTSVAEALSDLLVREDTQHALIETEALTSAHPALSDVQWMMPIRAVCELYRSFGFPLLLVVATIESDAELGRLLAATGADEHVVVALGAEPATLRERILAREPEGWSGREELAAATARLAPAIARLEGVALVLSTEGQAAETVALRVRDALPARGGPSR